MKSPEEKHKEQAEENRAMGIWSASAIGIGAMIGAGIFALVGIAVEIAGSLAYISFIIAGVIALLTSYSTAKLAATFPNKGGRVAFLNYAFGTGITAGSLNLMTCIGYVVVTSLYARAFGEYGLALIGIEDNILLLHLLSSGIVILFIGINFTGAAIVGKAGLITAAIQTLILLLFGLAGVFQLESGNIKPSGSPDIAGIILVSGIVFMSYEGFGLVANTAEDIKNPNKNLPRALYLSIFIVMSVYVLVNIAVIGNLSVDAIIQSKEYVLAEAALPIFGSSGFFIMGIAALFSTSSAINSTIYGPVNMIHETSKANELPSFFRKSLWGHGAGMALVLIGTSILILSNLLNLQSIAETGSLIFLVVYGAVNIANYRLYKKTKSKKTIIVAGILGNAFAFLALSYFLIIEGNPSIFVFVGIAVFSFLFELIYIRNRKNKN